MKRRVFDIFSLALLLVLAFGSTGRPAPGRSEYEVKAAFLYNFAQFIRWPDSTEAASGDTFVIGILGEDPFGEVIDETVANKTIRGSRLDVRRVATVAEAGNIPILFISRSEKEQTPAIIGELTGKGVVTVGETEDFCRSGGIISFYMHESKVRFEINDRAAEAAGIKISARLLKLARNVGEQPDEGKK